MLENIDNEPGKCLNFTLEVKPQSPVGSRVCGAAVHSQARRFSFLEKLFPVRASKTSEVHWAFTQVTDGTARRSNRFSLLTSGFETLCDTHLPPPPPRPAPAPPSPPLDIKNVLRENIMSLVSQISTGAAEFETWATVVLDSLSLCLCLPLSTSTPVSLSYLSVLFYLFFSIFSCPFKVQLQLSYI